MNARWYGSAMLSCRLVYRFQGASVSARRQSCLCHRWRASQALMLAVRARALLDNRFAPSVDDVLELAEPVLKHRMALTFAARAEGETIPNVIKRLKARIG